MPKVVSRAAISSSDQATATASSQAILRTFYCLCGEFLLVIDRGLDKLPRRKTDESYVIRCKDGMDLPLQSARKFKLSAKEGSRCLVKRRDDKRLELRKSFMCSRCNTQVAYQTGPGPIGSDQFLYLLKGGVTEQQGRIPDDAFEGEDAVKLTEEEAAMRREMEAAEAARQDKMGEETKKQLERDRQNLQVGGSRDEKLDMGDQPY
ncbi:hypothetical protein HD553DRAFT_311645 [Filobasidium floriforme]|uniref:uncharacterized protein n=1 Tax=Filobasidium floriforme TaxID=5210 RepID=UPI001E8D17BD|nr:uncharacterized protein HD553DRAFT_311645 [Filobasidium floriforme]KAH8084757.1 hypothetical protein HD553DRAFT_311645 [Filobasidium floriforme]